MSVETSVEEHRKQISNQLGEPDKLRFPDGWTKSTSWRRAQAAESDTSPATPAEFDVLLGYVDDLIDEIVYESSGLTDEEIAIVEDAVGDD
ncbi:hypothetical protein U4E84_12015 [Halorubrum sp. AD140]|uniref:hypothetical protein n=1 Tax=Halorubrum sp. AD140 TaxID=3050073 RepID=UPI002ACD0051|nr:hypothetical protein [Halorubrum sp. AD140]MDZ5812067.1 hypothetical protein [Halorubrum sp. AD140]